MLKPITNNILINEKDTIKTFLLICNEYKNIYGINLVKYMRNMITNKYLKSSRELIIDKLKKLFNYNEHYKAFQNQDLQPIQEYEYVKTINFERSMNEYRKIAICLNDNTIIPSGCRYGITNLKIHSNINNIDFIELTFGGSLISKIDYKMMTNYPFDIFNNIVPFVTIHTYELCVVCVNIKLSYDIVKIIKPLKEYLPIQFCNVRFAGLEDANVGQNKYLLHACYGIILKIMVKSKYPIYDVNFWFNDNTYLPLVQKNSVWELDFGNNGIFFEIYNKPVLILSSNESNEIIPYAINKSCIFMNEEMISFHDYYYGMI
jgi:hypothetical protein